MIFKRLRLAVFHRVECGIVEETLLETRVMNSECVSDRPYRAHYTSTAMDKKTNKFANPSHALLLLH